MLEIGKTYRLPVRGGLDVDIVGSGIAASGEDYLCPDDPDVRYSGRFFVGITRNDSDAGDWVASYAPDGRRLWEETFNSDHNWNLLVPERYVNLNDALSLIRSRLQTYLGTTDHDLFAHLIPETEAALQAMPYRELIDAPA